MLISTPKTARVSPYTRSILHLYNLMQAGVTINYDDLEVNEAFDLEYCHVVMEDKKEADRFKLLFEGFAKMYNKMLSCFKR